MRKNICIIWSLLLYAISIQAEVRLPGIFSDGMVLQREAPIPVWGWAEPKETVVLVFNGKQYRTKASRTGEWSIRLPKHKAGGPYQLKINEKTLQDVYIGDVYLCSGQSNMELTVQRVMDKYRDEIVSYQNNLIRYTKTQYAYDFIEPQQDSKQEWKICTRKNAPGFAALCYFFAKEMQAAKGVAIGIINSSWGGTPIAAWSTRRSLEKYPAFHDKLRSPQYFNPNYPDSVKKAEKELSDRWYHKQSVNDTGNKEKWTQAGFNDSDWEEVDAFNSNWGGTWNAPVNGVHYFRQRINISASLAGQAATLRVGTLKDADATFVNGMCVGKTSYQYPPRIYQVPAGTLRAGENEIVIRLVSSAGRPGFVKGKPYQLEIGNRTIPLAATWKHKIGCILKRIPSTTSFQNEPAGLYNSMIHPLRNYGIRGIIWYQGESDTGPQNSKLYESLLVDLANDWREQWGDKNLPFVIVQLANYQQRSKVPIESGNAQVREAQRKASLRLKNAGLATAIDLGESNDIHPLNKKDLAHRCVLQMNKLAFGDKETVAEGPMAETAELKENGRIVISFMQGTGALRQSESLEGIAVAGKDGKYKFVEAHTEGDKVIARWDGSGTPVSIRYAWENNPPTSIYNTDGLPASSFQIPVITHSSAAFAAEQFITFAPADNHFPLVSNGTPCPIYVDDGEDKGVKIAAGNLRQDILQVCGTKPELLTDARSKRCVIVGTCTAPFIKKLIAAGKIDKKELEGKNEKYILQVIAQPCEGIDEALVIAGSDRRGTIYGIYELSQQIGVSPWYWWADVPVVKRQNVSVKPGIYTDGEPAVAYRGIFLNDEAPCLTQWVKHTYGTNYGDHRFYAQVCELILRLKGNFLWPAMWSWAFYQDDPLNSRTASEMGVIIGTSHHEPMARNHQEWARKRKEYGAWDYTTNQKAIDRFFREGIERMQGTEDIVTIGMRGDGDAAMSESTNVKLLENIVKNQRKIIEKVTRRPAKETPQVWALYKEVLDYYDKGMRVPDDVIMLLCDDNWGNVCRLPNAKERKHPGGWGMYYHVDYVGAPRNSKWLNVTPIQNMWEQLQLTYDYGVEKLWILNVGDLKPMEYPITLFMDMAWNPKQFNVSNLLDHPLRFCAQQFGEDQAAEAMRILNLYSKYNGRVTAEMLDRHTYNLETGEWKQVSDEYLKLEAEALRQYISLKPEYKDAYKQLILFPVQAMANLYEMYYAQAMNHKLYKENNPQANEWADKVEQAFARDKALSDDYNNVMSGGKWKNMMIQKHIGYTSWNDNFPADQLPEIYRIENPEKAVGKYVFTGQDGYVAIEAEHYYSAQAAPGTEWTVIPFMGRTLSGIALMPYTEPTDGASVSYKVKLPKDISTATVHIVVKSTLAFQDRKGHKYSIGFEGGKEQTINFNHNLNELPENVYSVFYPTVARRIIEKKARLDIPSTPDGMQTLTFRPLHPGIVLEKLVIDYGGYKKSYLFMNESKNKREL